MTIRFPATFPSAVSTLRVTPASTSSCTGWALGWLLLPSLAGRLAERASPAPLCSGPLQTEGFFPFLLLHNPWLPLFLLMLRSTHMWPGGAPLSQRACASFDPGPLSPSARSCFPARDASRCSYTFWNLGLVTWARSPHSFPSLSSPSFPWKARFCSTRPPT